MDHSLLENMLDAVNTVGGMKDLSFIPLTVYMKFLFTQSFATAAKEDNWLSASVV